MLDSSVFAAFSTCAIDSLFGGVKLLSITQLAALTSKDRRFVDSALEGLPWKPGLRGAKLFESAAALERILCGCSESGGQSLNEAKRREAIASAKLKELTAAQKLKDLYPVADFWRYIGEIWAIFSGHFRTLEQQKRLTRKEANGILYRLRERHDGFNREHGIKAPWGKDAFPAPEGAYVAPPRLVVVNKDYYSMPNPPETWHGTEELRQSWIRRFRWGQIMHGKTVEMIEGAPHHYDLPGPWWDDPAPAKAAKPSSAPVRKERAPR